MNNISRLLLKASFFGTAAESMWVPLYAIFVERVGGSIIDAGIGYAIFQIVTGVVVVTFGRTRVFKEHLHDWVLAGFAIAGVGDLILISVNTKYELFAVQCLIGLSVGILNPAWDGLFSEDANEEENHGERWSLWSGGVTFFEGIAALISGIIVYFGSFKTMFLMMAILDSYAVYCAWKVRSEISSEVLSGQRITA